MDVRIYRVGRCWKGRGKGARKGRKEVLRCGGMYVCDFLFYLTPLPVFLMLLVATMFARSFGDEVVAESSFDIIVMCEKVPWQ